MAALLINLATMFFVAGSLLFDKRHRDHPVGHLIMVVLLIVSVWQLHDAINNLVRG